MGMMVEQPVRFAIADAVDRGAEDLLSATKELWTDAELGAVSERAVHREIRHLTRIRFLVAEGPSLKLSERGRKAFTIFTEGSQIASRRSQAKTKHRPS